jgi:hypothetical protein
VYNFFVAEWMLTLTSYDPVFISRSSVSESGILHHEQELAMEELERFRLKRPDEFDIIE